MFQPSDVAVIMYTSGSTGKPKGVVMLHTHLVAAVSGMAENVHLNKDDVYVSYLPLAHILAMQVENVLLINGGTICYSDPRELAKALPLFGPTIFAGVPKVFEILKSALEKKIAKGPPLLKLLFQCLIAWKYAVLRAGMDTPVSNLFFKLISKKVFGGVLRFGVTGGGPIGENLHLFSRACFCCPIIQGYALTETCVGGCFQSTDDTRCGVVGPPVPCVEVMLQSEPDIKDSAGFPYLHTDTVGSKGEPVIGRGEICMRGPCVSFGYYKLPEKTKEEFDDDGWFHTGDVGQFTTDGVIQIVDRKKNLVKLKGGEYVALESMENAFAASPLVLVVCVVANGDLDSPLAIVRAENHHLEQWAAENSIAYGSLEELAEKQETRSAIVKSMVECGKLAGLTPLELRIKDCVVVTHEEWGPGHGMTATMKIDRKQICKIYSAELSAMLKRNE
jgi:long-chain acyl-CoA synthetase